MHILTLFGWRVAKKGVSSLGALILLRAGYEPKCSLCLEDSAMAAEGSGAELEGEPENPRVGRPLGFSSRDDPFSGDRWTEDETSGVQGDLQTGDRTPEQEAVDLLMQAEQAQSLEPDYFNYESAEGENASPDHEPRVQAEGSQVLGQRAGQSRPVTGGPVHGSRARLVEQPGFSGLDGHVERPDGLRQPEDQGPRRLDRGDAASGSLNGYVRQRNVGGSFWEQGGDSARAVEGQLLILLDGFFSRCSRPLITWVMLLSMGSQCLTK